MIEGKKDPILLESEPIKITIEEPIGEDLEVWNRIKDNGEIAYFIQEGDFRPSDSEKKIKLKREIEEISSQYPTSVIAEQIGQSLEKFQAIEKRKAYLEKMKQPQ